MQKSANVECNSTAYNFSTTICQDTLGYWKERSSTHVFHYNVIITVVSVQKPTGDIAETHRHDDKQMYQYYCSTSANSKRNSHGCETFFPIFSMRLSKVANFCFNLFQPNSYYHIAVTTFNFLQVVQPPCIDDVFSGTQIAATLGQLWLKQVLQGCSC